MTLSRKISAVGAAITAGLSSWAGTAWAASVTEGIRAGLKTAAGPAYGETTTDPAAIVGAIISTAIGLMGVVLLCYLLLGGFTWMTAGGDETKVKKARAMITNAVIGIVIVVSAYAIANYVLTALSAGLGGKTGG